METPAAECASGGRWRLRYRRTRLSALPHAMSIGPPKRSLQRCVGSGAGADFPRRCGSLRSFEGGRGRGPATIGRIARRARPFRSASSPGAARFAHWSNPTSLRTLSPPAWSLQNRMRRHPTSDVKGLRSYGASRQWQGKRMESRTSGPALLKSIARERAGVYWGHAGLPVAFGLPFRTKFTQ